MRIAWAARGSPAFAQSQEAGDPATTNRRHNGPDDAVLRIEDGLAVEARAGAAAAVYCKPRSALYLAPRGADFLQQRDIGIASDVRLKATLFGEFRLETLTGTAIKLNNRRASLLIAILCLQPGHKMDRQGLVELLWPDRFLPQAKASLRQCLLDLKRLLDDYGFNGIEVTRTEIALNRNLIESDLFDLEAVLSAKAPAAAIEKLLSIGNRNLLEGASLNAAFDEWLTARRVHLDAVLRSAISHAISASDKNGTDRLLEAARVRFPSYRTFAFDSQQVSIAVLPFEQSDTVGGNFFLADGVTDELTSQLGRLKGIALAGRTSIMAVAGRGGTLTEMAAELHVSHLVEGRVLRTSDKIEVRVALIEGGSGTEIWSDSIVGSIEDFFESRRIIGANVIAAICRALGLSPSPAPMRRMTGNREAYSLYLQGRSLIQKSMQGGAAAKAIELLEESLSIDAEFAECWAALADAHIHLAVYTPCLDRLERSETAAECARRAAQLDPAQGQALAIEGIHEWTLKNPAGALDLAFEAYAREPQSADVASRLGSFLLYIGRTRDALPFVEAATEQDPVYGRNYAMLSVAHFNLGNIDRALAAAQRMVDLGMPGMWLAAIKAAQGDHEAAVADYYASRMLMNTVILPPAGTAPMNEAARDAYWAIGARGCCSGKEEDRSMYCKMLTGLHATMPDPYDPSIAFPAIWMGHSELVMKIYGECIHPANMFGLMSLWSNSDPICKTRQHPGFMEFAEKIGLVEAWNRYGWPDVMPSDPRNA